MSASRARPGIGGDIARCGGRTPPRSDAAVEAQKRATGRAGPRSTLLKGPDEAAPRRGDRRPAWARPAAIRDLIAALIKARDTAFKIEIIKVLGGLGEGYRVHVTVAFAQLWHGGDPAIRRAIVEAALSMVPASLEPGPTEDRA